MTRLLLCFAFSFFTGLSCYSQIIFEEGYFVNENNEKIDCWIKNTDWENNPTEFEYKLSPNDAIKKNNIQDTKEFGIKDVSRYIRVYVEMDRSTDDINKMTTERNPIFRKEQLFLKILVDGKISLN